MDVHTHTHTHTHTPTHTHTHAHTSAAKRLASVFEILANMTLEGEGPRSNDKGSFKELKDKSKSFLYFRISENCVDL